jgi:hypothetical protein
MHVKYHISCSCLPRVVQQRRQTRISLHVCLSSENPPNIIYDFLDASFFVMVRFASKQWLWILAHGCQYVTSCATSGFQTDDPDPIAFDQTTSSQLNVWTPLPIRALSLRMSTQVTPI